jgi:hypothetical protein
VPLYVSFCPSHNIAKFQVFNLTLNHPEMDPDVSKARLADWLAKGKPKEDWTVWLALVNKIMSLVQTLIILY